MAVQWFLSYGKGGVRVTNMQETCWGDGYVARGDRNCFKEVYKQENVLKYLLSIWIVYYMANILQ